MKVYPVETKEEVESEPVETEEELKLKPVETKEEEEVEEHKKKLRYDSVVNK